MKEIRLLIAALALLSLLTAVAQPQSGGNREQQYIYRTDADRIQAAVETACKDSLEQYGYVVRQALDKYLNDDKNVIESGNEKRIVPTKAKNDSSRLEKEIAKIEKDIEKFKAETIGNGDEPQVARMTKKQLKDSTIYWSSMLDFAKSNQQAVMEQNQKVKALKKYMANHQPVIEKSLEELKADAISLMAGRYNKEKNSSLAKELKQRFGKNKDALSIIKNLDNESQAWDAFNKTCGLLKEYIEFQDSVFLKNERAKFEKNYGNRYQKFIEAFDELGNKLEAKKLSVKDVDKILKNLIDNE